jgi:FkbM family methyltransferase
MLWRALSHIERGFYIDIGAQDPIIDSVSLAFHEHGWRGIHVEPLPHYADLLRHQRPGDTVIQAAVGNGPAVLRFFEIPGTGISTADASIAAQHRERGFDVHEIAVPCITLASIFDAAAEPEIHWLKIDVEGFEQPVLASWGSSAAQPWIVVVESTLPLTQIETHERWENVLIGYGYRPTYFDGLNRYYVSEAHPELQTAFRLPPNIFDDFALNGTASAPFQKLIVARDQERLRQALALAEGQKAFADSEIEQLTRSVASQQKAHTDRERTLLGQASQASENAEGIQHTLTQREKEFGEQLRATQQQSALESAEQARLRSEKELELQLLHTEQLGQAKQEMESLLSNLAAREKEVGAQLLTIQRQVSLENIEQARLRNEKDIQLQLHYSEQIKEAKLAIDSLQHTLVTREREFGAQLLAIEQKAALDRAEGARLRAEQERTMQRQHDIDRDQAKREMEELFGTLVRREQEIVAQLLTVQEHSARERAQNFHQRSEQESALRLQHAEREQALEQQLQVSRQELRSIEQNRVQRENDHVEQISQARLAIEGILSRGVEREREILALVLATQQQAHRETSEQAIYHREQIARLQSEHAAREHALNVKLEGKQLELLQSEAARKTMQQQLDEHLRAEREIGRVRQQAFSALELEIANLRNSLSWRLTAPLRAVKSWLTHSREQSSNANTPSENVITPEDRARRELEHAEREQTLNMELRTMQKELNNPPAAETARNIRDQAAQATSLTLSDRAHNLAALLEHQGRQFVECAYLTLLNRRPDPEGMRYYVQRLRSGTPKLQILSELHGSDEAKTSGANLPWLRKVTRWQRLGRLPLIGRVLKILSNRESISGVQTQLRIVEQQVFWLEELFASQLAPLRESLGEFRNLIRSAHPDSFLTNKISDSMTSGESIATNEANTALEPPGLDRLSPTARKVYIKLGIAVAQRRHRPTTRG